MNNVWLRLKIFIVILLVIMAIGTIGFMITEKLSLPDAFYFSVVTVATVGYGDIAPVTAAGRILSIFLIITGVGTFLGVVANATEIFIARKEKKLRRQKLNMVIGIFFSEAGTKLLEDFTKRNHRINDLENELIITTDWTDKQFLTARRRVKHHDFDIDIQNVDLKNLRDFLVEKGNFILRLLENQSLLEHESFTELLRTLVHLREELLYREDFATLPDTDLKHLAIDIKRVYAQLVLHWLEYIKHLKENYPYLFSLALRTNPFDRKSSPVVT